MWEKCGTYSHRERAKGPCGTHSRRPGEGWGGGGIPLGGGGRRTRNRDHIYHILHNYASDSTHTFVMPKRPATAVPLETLLRIRK